MRIDAKLGKASRLGPDGTETTWNLKRRGSYKTACPGASDRARRDSRTLDQKESRRAQNKTVTDQFVFGALVPAAAVFLA